MRLTIKATCPMNLANFPMDDQMCTVMIMMVMAVMMVIMMVVMVMVTVMTMMLMMKTAVYNCDDSDILPVIYML